MSEILKVKYKYWLSLVVNHDDNQQSICNISKEEAIRIKKLITNLLVREEQNDRKRTS